MDVKKKHHFIPRFYLNGFTDPFDSEFLWIYDKQTGKIFKSKPINVGYRRHYHSYKDKDGVKDTNTFEEALSELESAVAPIIVKLKQFIMPNIEERQILSFFIHNMMTRVPNYRESVEKAFAKHRKESLQKLAEHPNAFKRFVEKVERDKGFQSSEEIEESRKYILNGDYDVIAKPEVSLGSIFLGAELFVSVLSEMNWNFIKSTERFTFITSDNPFIMQDPGIDLNSIYRGVGLASRSTEVAFPIDKNIIFIGTWQKNLKEGFIQGSDQYIKLLNKVITIYATRQIYAYEKSKGLERWVKKYNKPGGLIIASSNEAP
jgi:hypothetical protein